MEMGKQKSIELQAGWNYEGNESRVLESMNPCLRSHFRQWSSLRHVAQRQVSWRKGLACQIFTASVPVGAVS